MNIPSPLPDEREEFTQRISNSLSKIKKFFKSFHSENENVSEISDNNHKKPFINRIAARPIHSDQLIQSDAVKKMLEILLKQLEKDTDGDFDVTKPIYYVALLQLRSIVVTKVEMHLPQFFETLETNMNSTYENIMKLYDDGENVDEYMNTLEELQKIILEMPVGDFIFLLSDAFRVEIRDPKLRSELKKWKQAIEQRLSPYFHRLKMLDESIEHHYKNKKLNEERALKREKARQEKALRKSERLLNSSPKKSIQNDSVKLKNSDEIDKLNAISTRLENIEIKIQEGADLTDYKEEILAIERKLQNFLPNQYSEWIIKNTKNLISDLLSGKVQKIEKSSEKSDNENENENEKKFFIPENIETHAENIEFLEKIKDLLSINYSISSTKNKTDSYGDGSFAMKTFRPFLHSIESIFERNEVSLRYGTSWAEIIQILEKNNDDLDSPRMLLRGILKKYKNTTNKSEELVDQLYDAIEDFSETNFAQSERKAKGGSLKNFSKEFWKVVN